MWFDSLRHRRVGRFRSRTMYALALFVTLGVSSLLSAPLKDESKKILYHLPPRNEKFVGRKDILKALEKKLTHSQTPMVTLVGLAGIGKSQIARSYAHTHEAAYSLIWWFDISQDLLPQFKALAEAWNQASLAPEQKIPASTLLTERVIHEVKSRLTNTSLSWLLIFDNGSTFDALKDALPPPSKTASHHIIITSRNKDVWRHSMKIEKFSRAESLDYLKKILTDKDPKELEALAETLGDYPLALTRAATYIKMTPSLTPLAYIALFQKKRALLSAQEDTLIRLCEEEEYHQTLTAAFELSLEELKGVSKVAYEALCFFSFLNHTDISKALICAWLSKRGYPQDCLHEIVFHLLARFYIDKQAPIDTNENPAFSIHEVVQRVVRDHLRAF